MDQEALKNTIKESFKDHTLVIDRTLFQPGESGLDDAFFDQLVQQDTITLEVDKPPGDYSSFTATLTIESVLLYQTQNVKVQFFLSDDNKAQLALDIPFQLDQLASVEFFTKEMGLANPFSKLSYALSSGPGQVESGPVTRGLILAGELSINQGPIHDLLGKELDLTFSGQKQADYYYDLYAIRATIDNLQLTGGHSPILKEVWLEFTSVTTPAVPDRQPSVTLGLGGQIDIDVDDGQPTKSLVIFGAFTPGSHEIELRASSNITLGDAVKALAKWIGTEDFDQDLPYQLGSLGSLALKEFAITLSLKDKSIKKVSLEVGTTSYSDQGEFKFIPDVPISLQAIDFRWIVDAPFDKANRQIQAYIELLAGIYGAKLQLYAATPHNLFVGRLLNPVDLKLKFVDLTIEDLVISYQSKKLTDSQVKAILTLAGVEISLAGKVQEKGWLLEGTTAPSQSLHIGAILPDLKSRLHCSDDIPLPDALSNLTLKNLSLKVDTAQNSAAVHFDLENSDGTSWDIVPDLLAMGAATISLDKTGDNLSVQIKDTMTLGDVPWETSASYSKEKTEGKATRADGKIYPLANFLKHFDLDGLGFNHTNLGEGSIEFTKSDQTQWSATLDLTLHDVLDLHPLTVDNVVFHLDISSSK